MGKTSDGSKTENDLKTITGTGSTLYLAVEDAQANVGKDLFFSHNQVLFLGEEVIKSGNTTQIIEEYLNYCDYHSKAYIAGVYGNAQDLVSLAYKDEYTAKNKLLLVLENANHKGIFPVYTIYETLMSSYSSCGSYFIPMLRKEEASGGESGSDSGESTGGGSSGESGSGSGSKSGGGSGSKSGGDSGGESGGDSGGESGGGESGDGSTDLPDKNKIFPDGGAVIAKNSFAGFIDKRKSEGLSLIMNTPHLSSVEIVYNDVNYTVNLFITKTKVIPKLGSENLEFEINFSATVDKAFNRYLSDSDSRFDHNANIDDFKKMIQESVQAKISEIIEPITGMGLDLFDFEGKLRHRNSREWLKVDDWSAALKNAGFTYKMDIKII
jgi:hypothetical protein